MERKLRKTLERLRPRFEPLLEQVEPEARKLFWKRLDEHFPDAFALLLQLYGTYYAFFYHLEVILKMGGTAFVARRPEDVIEQLKARSQR